MASQYNIHEAKTHLSRLVERAQAGEDIVIAKAGKPCVRLVLIDDTKPVLRKPGILKGRFDDVPESVWFDPLPDEELRAWGMI